MRLILVVTFFLFFTVKAYALCVTSSKTNLRTKPGSKNPVSWLVGKYTPLIEIRKVSGWYEVEDMDGELHWVYEKNVTKKITCVAVKTNIAKLRKRAGAQSELADLRQIDKYTPFKRVDVQGEWYEVEAGWGETYWIHESAVWRPVKVSRFKF